MTWKQRLETKFQQRQEQNLWRSRVVTQSPQSRLIKVDGRELLNFCSNDYLGLANHPDLIEAVSKSVFQWGVGSGASHLICGHSKIHEQLEHELADLVGAERALLFSAGYMANLAIPQTFLDRHDLLLQDKLNHASLLDAGQLTRAKSRRYAHADAEAAERMLLESNSDCKMLITDGVFSMDGDKAPVSKLNSVTQRHDCLMVVDEAHSFGVLGDKGAGLLQAQKIPVQDNVLMMGTLGKAAGCFGAFVAGDSDLIEALLQFARPYIYTTALPSAVCAATLAAVRLIRDGADLRTRLFGNVKVFRQLADENQLSLADGFTPIQPIIIGDAARAIRLSRHLWDQGFWVSAIRPPTVPAGSARLRITLTASHSGEDIERLIDCLCSALADSLL